MNGPKRLPQISKAFRSALLVLVLASVSGVAAGLYLSPTHPTSGPSFAVSHFQGDVIVTFRRGVSPARKAEITASVGGAIVLNASQNKTVLRFSPAITLDRAWTIVRQLEQMPAVESASPQFLDLGL